MLCPCVIIVSAISLILRSVAVVVISNSISLFVIVSTLVLRLKDVESFLDTSQCIRTQKRGNAEKSGLRDVKRCYPVLTKKGFNNPDKPKIFIKKNVRNDSFVPPVLSDFGEGPDYPRHCQWRF